MDIEEFRMRNAAARAAADPVAREVLDALRDQLLIVFLNRLGGRLDIPIAEIDGTGNFVMSLSLDQSNRVFTFEARKKQ